jgi:DNA polymerase elongation subunit (family B)
MAKVPVSKLRKTELVWLNNHNCEAHGHSYLSHYTCFINEIVAKADPKDVMNDKIPIPRRLGFLDIEASSLKANFGLAMCYCIKVENSDKIYERVVTKSELQKCLDREVIRQCVEDLKNFDKLVTYYGTGFDWPFLRTRAVYWGIPFPQFHELLHQDLYYIIRNRFSLGRKSLQSACNMLLEEGSHKTSYGRDEWIYGMMGRKSSLDYILEHCRYDVIDTEKLYHKVEPFAQRVDKSI